MKDNTGLHLYLVSMRLETVRVTEMIYL